MQIPNNPFPLVSPKPLFQATMKQHNNNNKTPLINLSILSTILLCFALLGQCKAHFPLLHNRHRQAYPPEVTSQAFSDTPTHYDAFGAPESSPTPSPSQDHHSGDQSNDHGNGNGYGSSSSSSSSFSSSFSDILRGTLRGHALTMPEHIDSQNQHNQALKLLCGHTDYPDVCLSTITPFLNNHNFDMANVLQAAIKACSQQIRTEMDKVSKHSGVSKDNMGASMLADCREQYNSALENLKRASDAIPSRDLGTVTIMLSAVMADVSTCESGFEDLKSSSFKADSDGLVGIMASNCLAIAHLVPH